MSLQLQDTGIIFLSNLNLLLSAIRVASLVTNAFTLWQGILQLRDILRSLAFLSDGFLAFELGIIGFVPLFELVVAFHHSSKR